MQTNLVNKQSHFHMDIIHHCPGVWPFCTARWNSLLLSVLLFVLLLLAWIIQVKLEAAYLVLLDKNSMHSPFMILPCHILVLRDWSLLNNYGKHFQETESRQWKGNCHKTIFIVSNTFCVRSLSVFSTIKHSGVFGSFYDKLAIISSDSEELDMEKHKTCKVWFKIMMTKKK